MEDRWQEVHDLDESHEDDASDDPTNARGRCRDTERATCFASLRHWKPVERDGKGLRVRRSVEKDRRYRRAVIAGCKHREEENDRASEADVVDEREKDAQDHRAAQTRNDSEDHTEDRSTNEVENPFQMAQNREAINKILEHGFLAPPLSSDSRLW